MIKLSYEQSLLIVAQNVGVGEEKERLISCSLHMYI